MKHFSRDPFSRANQTYAKYCLEVDQDILSVCNFIDNFNPNYNILNRNFQPGTTTTSLYYTTEQLVTLGILNIQNNTIKVCVDKMLTHQIVENTFGQTIIAGYSTDTLDTYSQEVPQGYAVRHDGYQNNIAMFTVISLASSGSYYIPLITLQDGQQ